MSTPEKPTTTENHAATAGDDKAGADATPARQLNANAKSFVPRLEGTPKTPGKGAKNNNANNNGQPASAAGVASAPSPNARAHPIPPPPPILAPFPGVPPLPGLGASPLFPGMINPLMMSPMLVAALARGTLVNPFVGPPMPTTPMTPAAPSVVNVGNASLQALRAGGPAKFACVLIVGMPRVGKTTIGRNLVQQLQADGLPWSFFSGGDYIKDGTGARNAPWDTTKEIFDALSRKIDDLQSQPAGNVRGLIIDKQCRGTEELYYLTALLRSKGLHLNGVVGLVADDDQKLMDRLGETDASFAEKCKFHRVIQTRIREVCKSVGLWHPVDALDDTDTAVRKVRSMVLGCSSQVPHKHLTPAMYHDSQSPMVDNYETYASVLNTVVQLTRLPKATQFPGFTNFTPLSNAIAAKKTAFKDYAVRRRSDGTKYILVYDGAAMYLVPRHMRCAFNLKLDAWLGCPLNSVAKFVLDGDLVRLSKERAREKFLVQDVICWIEKGSTSNAVLRTSWKDRQEKLTVFVCGEDSAFFGNCEVVVVHQTFVDMKNAEKLFEPCDYPTDGFVFQPTGIKREDPVYIWRPPESITVDFRLGPVIAAAENTRTYSLQVYDVKAAKFVSYGTDSVTIPDSRQFVVEGALCICSLKPEEAQKSEGRCWTYVRTRTDVTTSAYQTYVDDLLANCLVPKAVVTALLGVDPTQPRPAASATAPPTNAAAPAAAAATTSAAASVPTPSFQQQPQPQQQQQQRTVFGSALSEPNSALAALNSVVGNVHLAPGTVVPGASTSATSAPPATAVAAVRKPRGPTIAEVTAPAAPAAVVTAATIVAKKQKCWGCNKVGEGDVDQGDHKFYCLECWAEFDAQETKKTANGGRNSNGRERTNGGGRQKREARPATAEADANATAAAPGAEQHKKTRRGGAAKKDSGKATPTPEVATTA